MLEDLAELAEKSDDLKLSEIALRLRLIAGEPALRSTEVDTDEVLLVCDETGLRLIKSSRVSGLVQLMPTYRLECPDTHIDALCALEISGEQKAVEAFLNTQKTLKKVH